MSISNLITNSNVKGAGRMSLTPGVGGAPAGPVTAVTGTKVAGTMSRKGKAVTTVSAAANMLSISPSITPSQVRPTQPKPPQIQPIQPIQPIIPVTPVKPPLLTPPMLPGWFLTKTTTQLAQGAVEQLEKVNETVVRDAVQVIKPKTKAASLMNYLERKVKIGEVINELAKDWDKDTLEDFAAAFQMDKAKSNVDLMDSIVSLAILNDPDLEEEILVENTPETTENDLLENRRVVWQYPPAGTPLEPPYVILVAVEHQEVAKAEEVVQSIMGNLTNYDSFKIPKSTAQKLGKTK